MTHRSPRLLAVGVLVAVLMGCSNEEDNPSFERCGNTVLDGGEACDDGNDDDNDACLTSCELASCGDEFVNVGVEECDGRNLDAASGNFTSPFDCGDLGLSEGTLSCNPACRFDTSACGAAFTPTPLQPTATPTPTPTSTSTPSNPECGNGTIDSGETCDDGNTSDDDACPSDCQILPCTPLSTMRAVQVDFASPPFQDASSITLLLSYPDGVVSLPGMADDATVVQRITMRQTGATLTPNDLEHALRVVYSRPGRINPARIFVVTFDECAGAEPPAIEAFTCQVTGCSSSTGPIEGCTCTVSEPAP